MRRDGRDGAGGGERGVGGARAPKGVRRRRRRSDNIASTARPEYMSEASATLRALPGDVLERIAARGLAERTVPRVIAAGPLLARAVLGPGSLGEQGDAFRLVAERLGLTRTPRRPTWQALITTLRQEWKQLPVHYRTDLTSAKTFEWACYTERSQVARLCLARGGVHVEEALVHGHSALIHASRNNYLELAESLLEAKADVSAAWGDLCWDHGKPYQTVLATASLHGHLDMVRLLLGAGANVNQLPKTRTTALM